MKKKDAVDHSKIIREKRTGNKDVWLNENYDKQLQNNQLLLKSLMISQAQKLIKKFKN